MSLTNPRSGRPFYCSEEHVASYLEDLRKGGDPNVIRALQVIRAITLNLGIMVFGAYMVHQGANPTYTALGAFALLGGVNGMEYADWAAFTAAVQEFRRERNPPQE